MSSLSSSTPLELQEPKESRSVGLSNPQLSHSRRKMLDLVNKLHSTGVQVDLDLPQIAVIGPQSAGKSSLIEAISGITLPRAAGTCTRCPTECRLSWSDSPWQCIVSLRLITDSSGQPLGQASNQQFGEVIYDPTEVEDRIRRAQRAILNPQRPAKDFLGNTENALGADHLTFSHNSVTLQISGPDVADLSFCDLPGLIASVSSDRRGAADDIALVQSLVTSYIKKPSCIILLTVACETDFENQGAHHLAKKYDPEGKRTIGVLTKPDRIPSGEESNWTMFVKNEREPLEHGWFCVKQPSSLDLESNITWAEARHNESRFFSSKAPWCELDGCHQKYLRTSNLVEKLSAVLSDLVAKRLPQIQEELENVIIECRVKLAQLPRLSSDPRSEIATLIHNFTSDLARHVAGIADDAESAFGDGIGLIQAIRPAQERFRVAIRRTAPNFQPFERRDAGTRKLSVAKFLRSEEGDGFEGDGSEQTETDTESQTDEGSLVKGCPRSARLKNAIYIDEVLSRAHRARTRELPGNYPFVVQKSFIEKAVKDWQAPAKILCKAVYSTVLEQMKTLIIKHFSAFGQGHLAQKITHIIQQHMKQCLERAEERIEWLVELEEVPFSLNTHYLADYKSKFLAHYVACRDKYERGNLVNDIEQYRKTGATTSAATHRSNTGSVQPTGIAKILAGFAEIGMTGIRAEDLPKMLPPDCMEPALIIMADVRAYFQGKLHLCFPFSSSLLTSYMNTVAYKRFADVVPLAIDREVVRGVERNILTIIYSNLGINGPDGGNICKDFAEANPHVAERRSELQRKLERLENAGEELKAIV